VHRSVDRANADRHFFEVATGAVGSIIVSHVRQRTRGPLRIANTHPFSSSGWVFAHNGTILDVAFLEAEISRRRGDEIQGETDSERLFAYLLTALDEIGSPSGTREAIDEAIRHAASRLRGRQDPGTASFLLSDGVVLYAHRFGPPLFLLERRGGPDAPCHECAASPCIAVTTEPITDESWKPLEQGDLLRIHVDPDPSWIRI
jgi:predicted glutamine amidotransferase